MFNNGVEDKSDNEDDNDNEDDSNDDDDNDVRSVVINGGVCTGVCVCMSRTYVHTVTSIIYPLNMKNSYMQYQYRGNAMHVQGLQKRLYLKFLQ